VVSLEYFLALVTQAVFIYVDYLLLYLCDTEGGSSGSPIVKTADDDHRYIVGLHRGYINIGKKLYNYGSTMNAIVNHIHKRHKYGELPCNTKFVWEKILVNLTNQHWFTKILPN